jgi:UDP-N-acetylglucosamine 4,6-dehydratase/5-epimerase
MTTALTGASVLITGGTGSFGKTMARRLLAGECGQVHVLSRDEAKQDDMRRQFGDDRLRFHLGDIRDRRTVRDACRGVDYVFHAAALKQVPSCEFFPLEAVRTNVMGSANIIEAARANGVRTVVCLSTDKAVYPINAMGMSKALMEKVAQAYSRGDQSGDTVVCSVRYGNVLYSRGSVVPLFVELLKNSAPLTVTDPDMTRFLMSIDEAVALVEHAFTSAVPGDTFIRKAPACTIEVLARSVARLFGVEPKIIVIGTRHGEKLHETLLSREEVARAEDQDEFFRIPLDDRGGNYELYFDEGDQRVGAAEEYTSHNTERLDEDSTVEILRKIPEIRAELDALAAEVLAI